jgi:hypothetical protein
VQLIVGMAGGQHCFYKYGSGKVPSHTITSFVVGHSFHCCEFHTEQAEPSFVFVSRLSHAVQDLMSAGVQLIVGITQRLHCFCD